MTHKHKQCQSCRYEEWLESKEPLPQKASAVVPAFTEYFKRSISTAKNAIREYPRHRMYCPTNIGCPLCSQDQWIQENKKTYLDNWNAYSDMRAAFMSNFHCSRATWEAAFARSGLIRVDAVRESKERHATTRGVKYDVEQAALYEKFQDLVVELAPLLDSGTPLPSWSIYSAQLKEETSWSADLLECFRAYARGQGIEFPE